MESVQRVVGCLNAASDEPTSNGPTTTIDHSTPSPARGFPVGEASTVEGGNPDPFIGHARLTETLAKVGGRGKIDARTIPADGDKTRLAAAYILRRRG